MEFLEKIKKVVLKNIIVVVSILVSIISISGSIYYVYINKCEVCEKNEDALSVLDTHETNETIEEVKFKVDVKGAVKKPGVYEVTDSSTVSDAILLAGGITSSGTTTNINLSKKLKEEMVIYVFTKKEIASKKPSNEIACEVPKCTCEELVVNSEITTDNLATATAEVTTEATTTKVSTGDNSTSETKLISINTDSYQELMSLDGIGESKAKAIVEYRKTNGNFKTIEDIKNVSGIGESIYQKIKDRITV